MGQPAHAHEWATTHGDLSMAEQILASSRLYAISRVRVEHGDWAEATIALDSEDRRPSSDTFAQGVYWAYRSERMTRAEELMNTAIEVAVSLDNPSAALCMSSARGTEHPRITDYLGQLDAATSKLDLDKEWWVLIEMVDIAGFRDRSSEAFHLARLVEAAERLRVPTLMIAARYQLGHEALAARHPPDYTTANDFYTQAFDVANQHGDFMRAGECKRGQAICAVGLNSESANEVCRDALTSLYSMRYWLRIWQLFESIGLLLASTSHLEPAAIILGSLKVNRQPYGIENDLGYLARALEIIESDSHAAEWQERGAAMDRHKIVEYALAALQSAHESGVPNIC